MNQEANCILFSLLRSAICKTTLTTEEKAQFSEDLLPALFETAQKHDVANLLAAGLTKTECLPKDHPFAKTEIFKAVYRYERLNETFLQLSNTLESIKISFLPLKGSVLREFYPEPWMRTSCDIDILVKEADVEKAVAYLTEELGYVRGRKNAHDISLFSPNRVHVELHYDLIEDGKILDAYNVLCHVWDTATLRREYSYWYVMSDELFYFYHIAHMAKHFENGGCGIRPFLDLWILDHLETAETEKRQLLLKRGGLDTFADCARRLSAVWFGEQKPDTLSLQMEQYILRGGVYGTEENRIVVQQQKKGGKIGYALSKIFLPYDTLKFHYPILEKHRFLTPIMEIRRWCKLIFCGHAKRTINELKFNNRISQDQATTIQTFLKKIGL